MTANTDATHPTDPASLFSKGLEGVVAGQTSLSLVDGANSKLLYRGYSIHDLGEKTCFEETVFLLWYGRLPSASELVSFKAMLATQRHIHPDILNWIKKIPQKAHPMGVLRTMVSLLGLFDPDADNVTRQGLERIALRLIGAFPTILSALYRIQQGQKMIEPDMHLSHAANYLYMMHGKKPEPEMERALDAYLILLADHGLNASTFAARVTSATVSDMYSAVTSAVGTLKGDLHGSANQRAMEMILDIGDPSRAESYILHLLDEKKKVMGFGHRIYKLKDPRAVAFRDIAERLCRKTGQMNWLEISDIVEKVMWEKKQIPCNVDFFSASVLYTLGFPIPFFTTVFAASRVTGWTMHVIEQLQDNRLIRPQAIYTGPMDLTFTPLEQRSR